MVELDTTEAGGWIRPGDNATMKVILDAAPEIGKRFAVIVNRCKDEEINTFSNSETFAKNIFYNIKPEHHHGSIHFIKKDPDLKGKENGLIKALEIKDLNKFLDNDVPLIEITNNRSNDVKTEKFRSKSL